MNGKKILALALGAICALNTSSLQGVLAETNTNTSQVSQSKVSEQVQNYQNDPRELLEWTMNAFYKMHDYSYPELGYMHYVRSNYSTGKLKSVKDLIDEKGLDINSKENYGYVLLEFAAMSGNLDSVKYLIDEKGLDANFKDDCGYTILMFAAGSGNLDLVKYLINEKNADVNAKNNNEITVLMCASCSGNAGLVKYLLEEKGADVNAKDKNDTTALLYAVESEALLVDKRMDFLVRDENLQLCVDTDWKIFKESMHRFECEQREVIKLLIEKGADVNAKNKSALTPLIASVKSSVKRGQNTETMKLLIENGANVDYKGPGGTALMYACYYREYGYGCQDIVKLLVESGANTSIKDYGGKTALDHEKEYEEEHYYNERDYDLRKLLGESATAAFFNKIKYQSSRYFRAIKRCFKSGRWVSPDEWDRFERALNQIVY